MLGIYPEGGDADPCWARMLRCGNHPLKLWITLWVNGFRAALRPAKSRVCINCCIFQHSFLLINQPLKTMPRRRDSEMALQAQCWRGCGLVSPLFSWESGPFRTVSCRGG